MAWILIENRGFVDFQIAFGLNFITDRFVNHREHLSEPVHPVAHRLSADVDPEPGFEDLCLAIERKMVAVFSEHDAHEKPRRGVRVIDDPQGRRRDHRRLRTVIVSNIFRTDHSALKKLSWNDVEFFDDLFSDALEGLGLRKNLVGFDDDFFDG